MQKYSEPVIKKIIICAVIPFLILTISCRSLEPTLHLKKVYFENSLNPIKVYVNRKSIDSVFDNSMFVEVEYESIKLSAAEYENNLVHSTISNNLFFRENNKSPNIYLSVILRKIKGERSNLSFLMFPLGAYGLPANYQVWTAHIEAAVINKNGRIVKTYTSSGNATATTSFYWGSSLEGTYDLYRESELRRTAYLKAIINACTSLRSKIQDDAEFLNSINPMPGKTK